MAAMSVAYISRHPSEHRFGRRPVEIELTQWLRIEPSYAVQVDTSMEPRHVDRVGLALKFYR